MITFEAFDHTRDWGWVSALIPVAYRQDMRGIVAIKDFIPVGAVLLEGWTHNGCFGHMAATTPLVWKYGLHKEVFNYVFNTCGRKFMLGLVPEDNTPSMRLSKRLGFEEVYRIEGGFSDGVDMILFKLDKENCIYLSNSDEQKHSVAA